MMEEIMSNNEMMEKVSFPDLEYLELENLPNLASFSSAIFLDFPLLKRLSINDCPELKGFISKLEENFSIPMPPLFNEKAAFPKLNGMQIGGIDKLKIIWHYELAADSFCRLENLTVKKCKNLMKIIPSHMYHRLCNLKSLEICDCGMIKEVGLPSMMLINQGQLTADFFGKLKEINVYNCKSLTKMFSYNVLIRLQNLSKLIISNCEMMEEVFDLEIPNDHQETSEITHIQLKELRLAILPKLKHVWSKDPRGTFKFQDLRSFIAYQCQSLKNLFPSSVAKSLLKLQKLHITNCAIEEIVAKDEVTEIEPPKFLFPQFKEMVLVNLPKLVSFYPGLHTSSWPSLSKIDVVECMKVKVLMSEVFSFQEMHGLTHRDIPFQQPLFLVEKVAQPRLMMASEYSFGNLKDINIHNCKGLKKIFSSNIPRRRLQNLSQLNICKCDMMEEVFEIQISNDHHPETSETTFIQLGQLTLAFLPKLKHVWTEDPQGTLTFQNLQVVEAYECHSLKNLFPSSVARSLVQLQKLCINKCGIEEIVAKEEGLDSAPTKFVFPKLEVMVLEDLPNLVSLYPGLHTASWPSLRNLHMVGCVKVKLFASELFFSCQETHRLAHHDIPSQQSLFSAEEVGLGLPNMMLISQQQLTADFFSKLEEIKVYDCKSLTKMFSSNILRSLHNLSKLVISKCDMLEEVFEVEISSNDHRQTSIHLKELRLEFLPNLKHIWSRELNEETLDFQDLQRVYACECQHLKYLFPPSVAKNLLQLRELSIKNCGIEQIVAKEKGLEAAPHRFVFPELEVMLLENLPNLVCFYPGLHTSSWPSLRKLDMVNCMKVKVFASELCFSFREEHELAHHDIPNQLQPLFSVEKVGLGSPRMMMISQDQLTEGIFGKLKEVKVYACKSLMKMFSSNILRRLHNLSKLVISNCEMMEEVFEIETSNDHHHGTLEATVAIHLTMLELSLLPKLKHVWSKDPRGKFTFQDLQMINVNKCQSLKILFPTSVAKNLLRLQNLCMGNCGIEQIVAKEEGQDQAIPTFMFPQLNSLALHNLPQLMCFYPGLHALRLPLLRWLQVSYFMKAKDLSLKFLRFQDTSRLIDHEKIPFHEHLLSIDKVTSSSQGKDPVGDQEECAGTLSCLSGLRLYDMPNLLHLREESYQPQTVFQNLIDLDILRCGRIKKLVPSSISFHNLVTLTIRQCHGMPSLLTSQTARSMAQLQRLIIFNCKRIAEIIVDAEEGDDIEGGEIIFARLKTLILDYLPSLTSFYSGKYILGFPHLVNVTASRCFELQSFSQHGHMVSTPKLHKLVTVGADHKVIDDINTITAVNTPMDLNTTITELWKSHPCTALQELFSGKDLAPSNPSIEQFNI